MPNDIFSALADPTRRKIMEMLADHDEFPASEIHNRFEVSPQAISQHLKILREANLVHVEKRAQQRIYRINTETMMDLEEWTKNMRQRWSRRLDKLEAVLKAEMQNKAAAQTGQEETES
ncbi:winged helix-turn-helix transcriptional regulator [Cohnella pontilimi]|uniref:Winged helix-turn-helix transcriptional regulator n=1 Tax=Cohnella pontilimi TaxID=2564100 RepID=A0A4U0FGR3_9BACL|nr:metalloregulator ArsR/SmtB family transcription factor [Cohnella pontilimi]TJY44080.1 winged helix-turn-helix transcriptional regulator [Cohnella pontilimi]